MPIVNDDSSLRLILSKPTTIAVLGAKDTQVEAAFYVPAYLAAAGFSVQGVNPKLAGSDWLGRAAVASLAGADKAKLIQVFRRSEALEAVTDEILALPWQPDVVWFQLGIVNDAAAERLSAAGITVVQDRCMMPEHRRLVGR